MELCPYSLDRYIREHAIQVLETIIDREEGRGMFVKTDDTNLKQIVNGLVFIHGLNEGHCNLETIASINLICSTRQRIISRS